MQQEKAEKKSRRKEPEFDITQAPRVLVDYSPAWLSVQALDGALPNIPMPTYQQGNRIVMQHTAENFAFVMKFNRVEQAELVQQNWVENFKRTDNADRYELMCQCKAYETQILPEIKRRMADAGLVLWDSLYSHQVVSSYLALLNNSYGLLLDMGTGKGRTALNIAQNRLRRQDTMSVLLVIPASLHNTWDSEIKQIREITNDPNFELVQLSGSAEERRYQLKHCRGPYFSINYEMLNTLMPELQAKQFNMLVFDESSKVKSPEAQMTLASWTLAQQARYKLILNGSPYSKCLSDIHSQINVLQYGSLFRPLSTDPYAFKNKYTVKAGFNNVPKHGAVEAVNRALYSYSIRYETAECLDLPELTAQNVYCDMTPKQWEVYREVESQTFTEVCDRAVRAENRLSKLSKIFQITSGFVNDMSGKPVLFEPKAPKVEALREMLSATQQSIIVFAWHTFLLEMLHEEYKDESVLYYGSMSAHDKTRAETTFAQGGRRIFFGQELAACRGLNLQISPYSIFLERNHSLDNYTQALKRNHRNGQINRCFTYNLMVPNTVDTDIDATIIGKQEDSDEVLLTVTRNMAARVGR